MMQFINPEDLPEGMLEAIKNQADQHQMIHDVQGHLISQFLSEAGEDHLIAFRLVLSGCEGISAAYWTGRVTQTLESRFGICAGCSSKHPDPSDFDENAPEEPAPPPARLPGEQAAEQVPEMLGWPEVTTGAVLDEYGPDHPEWSRFLERYGMEYVPIEGNPDKSYLRCKGCKTPSPGMADRMILPPGVKGCSACQQAAKWG